MLHLICNEAEGWTLRREEGGLIESGIMRIKYIMLLDKKYCAFI